jgi:predicted NBD/HSP70 family sugar kinase
VTNGRGIGAGIVVEGEIHRGRRGGAGEFGHTLSEPGGRVCGCGRRGCLEAYASETALLARYAETRPDGALPDIDTFLARADAGDGLALELLRDAGERTGRNLGDLVNLLAPEGIVFGGEGVRLGERFFAPLREALESRAYPGLADDLPVLIDAWDDDAWARGAASLVVHEAFSAARLTPAVEAVKGPL